LTAVLSRKRAIRYQLSAPVLYRPAGQEQWSEGTTLNVSPSGVLICGDLPDACAEPVAVVIALPTSSGSLTGRGRIVRVAETRRPSGPSLFAIAISRFALERQSVALSHLDALHQEC
jgi:hypothetical protein